MPMTSCTVCGAAGVNGRCIAHPRASTPNQQRGYRGLAAYRAFRDRILERDAGMCGECGRPGANELGHRIPYSQQDPATRDDPSTWSESDFYAIHADCNKRLGANPSGAS